MKERNLEEITAVEEFAEELIEDFKGLPLEKKIVEIIKTQLALFKRGFELYAKNQEEYFNEARH